MLTLLVLAILAGAFISMGALFFTVVVTGNNQEFGLTRFFGGQSSTRGLIIVVVASEELFSVNNLITMVFASG